MAYANLQENGTFGLIVLTFSGELKWKDYIQSITKSAATDVGLLRRARISFLGGIYMYIFIS